MPEPQLRPAPWRLRWIALIYAVFVLGVYGYVLIWELVTDPADTSFWAAPLHLVSQPLSRVLLAAVPDGNGDVLAAFAGLPQAVAVFLLCRWFDFSLARHYAARRTEWP